jgi:hypothetical protein
MLSAIIAEATQKMGYNWPVFHWYVSDLVCMPVFIACAQFCERKISGNPLVRYDVYKTTCVLVMVALTYEVILPAASAKYTSDLADVVCYITGTILYYLFNLRKAGTGKPPLQV